MRMNNKLRWVEEKKKWTKHQNWIFLYAKIILLVSMFIHHPLSHRLTWLYLDIYDEIQECQSEENTYQQHPTMARVGNELRNITRKVSSVYKMKNIFFKWIKLKAIFAIENDDATWKLESFSVSETGGQWILGRIPSIHCGRMWKLTKQKSENRDGIQLYTFWTFTILNFPRI